MGLEELDLQSYVDYKVSEIMELKNKLGFRVTLIYADGSTKVREHGGFTKKADANAEKNNVISQLHRGGM